MDPRRRWWSIGWACAAGVGLGLGACIGGAFLCDTSAECGSDGVCQPTGYCSFPDGECDSGQRYGEHAGTGLEETCVEVELAGSSTAPDPQTTTGSGPAPAADTGPDLDDDGTATRGGTTSPASESTSEPPALTSETGPIESTGPGLERVTEGLLVLYSFDEGHDTTVHDVSGFETPMNLTIEGTSHAWVGDGLAVENDIVRSMGPATKVIEGCQATNEFSAEVWFTPAGTGMDGPARIITLSLDHSFRNFTLGQGQHEMPSDAYIARIRTSDLTGDSNGNPQRETGALAVASLTHVVLVRSTEDDGVDRIYVNGQLEAQGVRTGSFSAWNDSYELAFGNEPSLNRPWAGTLHLGAIYDRALSGDEVARNFAAGF